MKPDRILYVSCNPQTLGRDLKYIHHQLGYRVKAIQPVDLFPGSAHIETVRDRRHDRQAKATHLMTSPRMPIPVSET